MRRRWFFGVSLTETARWTIAVMFLAVAVLATPMPMAMYIVNSDHLLGATRLLGHRLHTVGLFSLALAFCAFRN
jgi:hypothetical protein